MVRNSDRRIKLNDVPTRKSGDKETLVMDPIHGFIDISQYPVLKEIIETPYFQRLRRLYQLGLASTVYPNATHSRFAHSLGVMHTFLILFDSITRRSSSLPQKRIKQLRPLGAVAALLHDVGHGPFSHASEHILENGNFDHEAMTRNVILNTEISKILEKNKIKPQLICDILRYEVSGDLRFVSLLVSSELDADRLDYLMRDSFFTGVNYGQIEVQRIANTLQLWEKSSPTGFKWTLVVSLKGLSAIEDYVIGRYLMYEGVYFHKVTRSTESLLKIIFERASKTAVGRKSLEKYVNITKPVMPETLLKLDDTVCFGLFNEWKNSRDAVLKDLSNRLINRDLLSVIQLSSTKYTPLTIKRLQPLKNMLRDSRYDPDYYFIEDMAGKSPYGIYKVREIDDEKSAKDHIMLNNNGTLQEVSERSTIIRTLSDYDSNIVNLIFPHEYLPKVKQLLTDKLNS